MAGLQLMDSCGFHCGWMVYNRWIHGDFCVDGWFTTDGSIWTCVAGRFTTDQYENQDTLFIWNAGCDW